MIPSFPEFTRLTPEHKLFIEKYTSNFPPYSDHNFTSMLIWDINSKIQLSILNDNLVVKFKDYESDNEFFSFIGNNLIKDTVNKLLDFSSKSGHGNQILLLPKHNFTDQEIKTLSLEYDIVQDRDNYDYILKVDEIATFHGTRYLNKRNKLNHFIKNHKPGLVIKNLVDSDFQQELIDCFKKWLIQKEADLGKDKVNYDELTAFKKLLKHHKLFDIYALAVYIDNSLEGFSLFEIINKEYAQHPFQKANKKMKGIYEYLNHNMAKYLNERGIRYLNIYQDLGHKGLRKGKMDYNPDFLVKFKISKKPS